MLCTHPSAASMEVSPLAAWRRKKESDDQIPKKQVAVGGFGAHDMGKLLDGRLDRQDGPQPIIPHAEQLRVRAPTQHNLLSVLRLAKVANIEIALMQQATVEGL